MNSLSSVDPGPGTPPRSRVEAAPAAPPPGTPEGEVFMSPDMTDMVDILARVQALQVEQPVVVNTTPAPAPANPPAAEPLPVILTAEDNPEAAAPAAAPKKKRTGPPIIAVVLAGPRDQAQGAVATAYAETEKAIEEFGGEVRHIWNDGRNPKELLDGVDGVVLPAGLDVNPATFKGSSDPRVPLNLASVDQDAFDIGVAKEAMKQHMPLRGIDRGAGIINLAAGGTLRPIPPAEADDKYYLTHDAGERHAVAVLPQSEFHRQIGTEMIYVTSAHRQALASLGPSLMPVAVAADNCIEAIEQIGRPTIGVQFRPDLAGPTSTVRREFFTGLLEDAKEFRDGPPEPPPQPKRYIPTAPAAKPVVTTPPLTAEERAGKRLEGLQALTQQGYTLLRSGNAVTAENISEIMAAEGNVQLAVRKDGSTVLKFERSKLDDFLMSVAPGGPQHLTGSTRKIVHLAQQIKEKGGHIYIPGMLSKTEITFNIEADWNLTSGLLVVKPDGKKKKVSSLDELDQVMTVARQHGTGCPCCCGQ